MKLIHLSDLHGGKRINEMSRMEAQEYIQTQIPEIICEDNQGAAPVMGNVHDRTAPSAEAVQSLGLSSEFVDEGFGSLRMSTNLTNVGSLLGVLSHVAEWKDRIAARLWYAGTASVTAGRGVC